MPELPIEEALPALRDALRRGTSAVLQAPPGAGKTTRVPLALLDEPWLAGQKIVMLEPRRLAARAAARRMAQTLGERVGDTVGHRVRMDTRVGPRTRVEVVTEGVLARMLQSDPALEGVGLVVFDEFHERSLHADLGLALALQSRSLLRDQLRILVMSATLDGEAVAALLGDAPVVTSAGRAHPVDTRYLPRPAEGWLDARVARAALDALRDGPGDVLVFLPGQAEIRRVEERLREAGPGPGVRVAPLHGSLPQDAQDRAVEPSPPGERKVVLATSIAETSLTIEGVRVVVDSGVMRVPRFSPRTGMTRLETVPVTRASAEQRRGRAGRTGPGVCYRLWTEAEQRGLVPHAAPEILAADLAPLALELAAWGVADPAELRWLDPPPAAAFAQARELLAQLGALDAAGAATPHGRRMAALGTHPRLAHLLLRGAELGLGALACDLAALLEERDPFRSDAGVPDADLRLRLEALRDPRGGGVHRGHRVDAGALHRVRDAARHLRESLGIRGAQAARPADETESAGLLLAFAYPDRIAQRRPGQPGRFLLRGGRGAVLEGAQALAGAPYLVAAELDGQGRESRVWLAAPLAEEDLLAHFGEQTETEETVAWDAETGSVRARRRERLGALVLRDAPLADPDPEAVAAALLDGVARAGIAALPWTRDTQRLRERLTFLHRHDPAWPDASDAALLAALPEWLGPHLYGLRRMDEVRRLDPGEILLAGLPWERRAALDELAPSHVQVPSGSRIPVDYSDPDAPVLAVRLQEVFGMTETPRVAGGRVPLTLHLLSPAHRPVQVTRDLASFWRGTYFDVKKDLKGRYPKHYWPDDPLQATPTHRTRPRPT
ncbi:MAG: ATP-dependent helicase HrpB [Gemmatimonadota bacterium]